MGGLLDKDAAVGQALAVASLRVVQSSAEASTCDLSLLADPDDPRHP